MIDWLIDWWMCSCVHSFARWVSHWFLSYGKRYIYEILQTVASLYENDVHAIVCVKVPLLCLVFSRSSRLVVLMTAQMLILWCLSGLRSCVISSLAASLISLSFLYRSSLSAVGLFMHSLLWQQRQWSQTELLSVFCQQVADFAIWTDAMVYADRICWRLLVNIANNVKSI